VRLAAVQTISTLPGPGRLPLITRALRDKNPHVVAGAAHALFEAAPLFEIEEIPAEKLSVTVHTPDGPVTHETGTEAVKAPEVPAAAVLGALKKTNPESHLETTINLLRVAGRLRIEKTADQARTLAGHHNPAIRREARRVLTRLKLDPGPEIAPDPPNPIDLTAVARIVEQAPQVPVETSRGTFVVSLNPEQAPGTVLNFLALVRRRFYEGVRFHRVVPGFVAQVGDPTGTGFGGPGYMVRCEVSEERYQRGSVGMALAGPDTGGSQLFITVAAQPHLERRYTLFGRVTEGMEVVDSLQQWDHIIRIRIQREPEPEATDGGPAPPAAPDGGP
jgi:cyclophilin family peptidyl-prolyl cis-trans isomerase